VFPAPAPIDARSKNGDTTGTARPCGVRLVALKRTVFDTMVLLSAPLNAPIRHHRQRPVRRNPNDQVVQRLLSHRLGSRSSRPMLCLESRRRWTWAASDIG
jgi:hypothetical protein